ncbi:hypothetical protein LIA77_01767 [Sarocladium implicatum]|nr:hypothetical protein LIA77_01767 [Sarocladium implicatum]
MSEVGTKVAVSRPEHGKYPKKSTLLEFQAAEPCDILPTVVTYPTTSGDSNETYRWFKVAALCSRSKEDSPITSVSGKTMKPARQLLERFLLDLSIKIRHCMSAMYPQLSITWRTENIDFVFSVPSIVGLSGAGILTKLAKECHFESANGKHRVVEIALTEPEAAATYKGHTALIVDVGGGTSDLSMMTILEDDGWKLDTNFLQPVSSQLLGGAHMDRAVLKSVEELFLQHVGPSDELATCLGEIPSTPGYFKAKTKPTKLLYPLTDGKWNGILSMIDGYIADTDDNIRVSRKELTVEECVFDRTLDEQIFGAKEGVDGIVGQVITMCDDLFVRCPGRLSRYRKNHSLEESQGPEGVALDFVIFAGGLARSERLRNNVEAAVKASADSVGPNVGHIVKAAHFVKWDEEEEQVHPQMFVCMGLVRYHIDGIQRPEGRSRFMYKTWLRTLMSLK